MTTLNTLQELTEKIHTHCPELMELSLGCEVTYKDPEHDYDMIGTVIVKTPTNPVFKVHSAIYEEVLLTNENVTEILGHPITLEHVLKAMKKSPQRCVANIEGAGETVLLGTRDLTLSEFLVWNLTKPLSEQSEETIEWFNEIIV